MNNRSTKTLSEVTQTLANAISDFIQHPQAPRKEADELCTFYCEMMSEYDGETAAAVKRDLPWLMRIAAQRQMEAELDVKWPDEVSM
jgi:hypothetical protein